MFDSGAHLFLSGQFYYRQIDDLAVNVCAAQNLSDAGWREYLESTHDLAKKGRFPKVSAITFAHDHPNASQRRMSKRFLDDKAVPPLLRIAVFTESLALRGAMTAFSWFVQDTALRPFASDEVRGGLSWLREAGRFDPARALDAWREGHLRVGLTRPTMRPSA